MAPPSALQFAVLPDTLQLSIPLLPSISAIQSPACGLCPHPPTVIATISITNALASTLFIVISRVSAEQGQDAAATARTSRSGGEPPGTRFKVQGSRYKEIRSGRDTRAPER